jgi:Domain of unknown function (DUF5664)
MAGHVDDAGLGMLRSLLKQQQQAGLGETRVTNEKTGGEKGSKLARYDLIPPAALDDIAKVYGKGCEKYAARNWERGYAWGLSFAALQRHAWAFWRGEYLDPESGLPHLAHAAWHCLTLMTFQKQHPELDDRFVSEASLPPEESDRGLTRPHAPG